MITRRIVTTVCALCFAVPAAAGASPAQNPPIVGSGHAVHGAATAKGPYGIAPVTSPQDAATAKGPYGIAPATAPARATVASHGDNTSDWRTAALSEAALLAALALGSALLLQTRRSAPRTGT